MAISHAVLVSVFGILGDIISFFVCLAPIPTFIRIYKRKTSEGYQSIPYVIGLFSAMLWIYYALIRKHANLLISINSVVCVIQILYIFFYVFYATKKDKILTLKLVLAVDIIGFGLIFFITYYFTRGKTRVDVLGYICMAFALSVFVAPLGIIRKVVKTKSVEFMPFFLSFFLTLAAVMWFFYGLLLNDMNIALPNVLGFVFGILQMILYLIYKNPRKKVLEQPAIKLQEMSEHVLDVVKLSTMVCAAEMRCVVPQLSSDMEATIDINEENKEALLAASKN